MSTTNNPVRTLQQGFGTFRLFFPGRADQMIADSRRRQEESLNRLRKIFPKPTAPNGRQNSNR